MDKNTALEVMKTYDFTPLVNEALNEHLYLHLEQMLTLFFAKLTFETQTQTVEKCYVIIKNTQIYDKNDLALEIMPTVLMFQDDFINAITQNPTISENVGFAFYCNNSELEEDYLLIPDKNGTDYFISLFNISNNNKIKSMLNWIEENTKIIKEKYLLDTTIVKINNNNKSLKL